MSQYITYYDNQAGGGTGERYNRFGRIYVGAPYQRGHGIGAFLGGLFRRILPFLGGAARAVGKEALSAGVNVLGDIATRRIPLKESLENRLTESGMNLKRKASDKLDRLMSGSGYKRSLKGRRVQKRAKRRRGKSSRPSSKKKKRIVRKKKKRKTVKKKGKRKRTKSRTVHDIFN